MTEQDPSGVRSKARVIWVDVLKGTAIALVVLNHSYVMLVAGGFRSEPWSQIDALLLSVRMPLFFVASGLFASPWLRRSWEALLRRKVLLLVYLYAIWTLLLFAVLTTFLPDGMRLPIVLADVEDLARSALVPGSSLWFIYALALYFVLARALVRVPALILVVTAAAVSVAATDVFVIESVWRKVLQYFVFFMIGCHYRDVVFRLAARARWLVALVAAPVVLVLAPPLAERLGIDGRPLVALAASAAALLCGTAVAVELQTTTIGTALAWLGQRTLQIYLLHFPLLILMAFALDAHLDGIVGSAARLALPPLTAAIALAGSLGVHRILRRVPGLFEVPGTIDQVAGQVVRSRRRQVA